MRCKPLCGLIIGESVKQKSGIFGVSLILVNVSRKFAIIVPEIR